MFRIRQGAWNSSALKKGPLPPCWQQSREEDPIQVLMRTQEEQCFSV